MADYTNIQHGDLDDAAAITVAIGHSNLADYVGFGMEMNVDFDASPPTLDMTNGKVFLLLDRHHAPGAGHDKHECLVLSHYDARSGLELPHSVNYIWAVFQMGTNDSPYIEVTASEDRPVEDSLLVGRVNTDDENVFELNRAPNGEYDILTSEDLYVNNSITWPDGVTTNEHPLTYGETIENRNLYYDRDAQNPPGVVQEAEEANEADHATTADYADYAVEAGNSDTVDGYHADDLLEQARDLTAGEWKPLLDEPYEKTDLNDGPDVRFDLSDEPYDRYRVRLQMENHHTYSNAIGCNINDITSDVYSHINLLPSEKYGERVTWRTGTDTWTVGDVMADAHALQDFHVSLPDPIVSNGPRRKYPVMHAGHLETGTVRSYHLTGICTRSVDSIDEIRLSTGAPRLALRVQIYGQTAFPRK